MQALTLFGDQRLDRRALGNALQPSRFIIKPSQRPERFVLSDLRFLHSRFEDANGFIINLQGDRVGMPVLAAMGQREACRVRKPAGCPVHDLGHKSKRLDRSRTHTRREKEFREIRGAAIGGGGKIAMRPTHMNIARAHIVMGRHHNSGLGLIMQDIGDDKRALDAYHKALDVYPRFKEVSEKVKTLVEKVEGRGI
jgi:hypothetical protein